MNIGICGSDIHVYHGKHPFTKYPVTQGHEVSGEIAKVGKDVTEFHEGQKVTIEPQVYCGQCYPCRHGKYNLCEKLKVMGFQTTGTASEYFAVDAYCTRFRYNFYAVCAKKSREETCIKNVSSLDFLTFHHSDRYNVLIKACK